MKHRIDLLDMSEEEIRYLYALCVADNAARTGDIQKIFDSAVQVHLTYEDLLKNVDTAETFQEKMIAAIKACSCNNPNCELHYPNASHTQQSF